MISIYTDGACRGNPGKGSWAVIILNNNKEKISEWGGYDPSTTNNKMELTAILQAMQYIDHNKLTSPITIYSDSEYAIKALNLWMDGWVKRNWKNVKNLDLLKPISILKEKLQNVKYEHVRGHSGDHGNELADEKCNSILDSMKTR